MTDLSPLFPRQRVLSPIEPLVGGGGFDLSAERPEQFLMAVFYRRIHCPLCKVQLRDLEAKLPEFERQGVAVVAISSDLQDRAERTKAEWGLTNLRVGYDLDLTAARAWGLYVSAGIGKTSAGVEEPALFAEPALYLVKPDGTLYFGSVQTMPFSRPHFADVLTAVDFVLAKNYPARGEVIDLPSRIAAVE